MSHLEALSQIAVRQEIATTHFASAMEEIRALDRKDLQIFRPFSKNRLGTKVESHNVKRVPMEISAVDIDADQAQEWKHQLELRIKRHVVGQDAAVEQVAATMTQVRMTFGRSGRPAGVMLLAGPPGRKPCRGAAIPVRLWVEMFCREMVLRVCSEKGPAESPKMFDRIAGRYDMLNTMLSFGRDAAWRKRLAACACSDHPGCALDLATGTGEVLFALARQQDRPTFGIGLDRAGGMLAIGQRKLVQRGLNETCAIVRGDAAELSFSNGSFDVITIAFGIRNVPDVKGALEEMCRVLRRGGRLLVLEFSLPANPVVRAVYLIYFRYVLPYVGAIVSGDRDAYRYLNRTVESFPYGEAFCRLLAETGFRNISAMPLTFGIATIYQGEKK